MIDKRVLSAFVMLPLLILFTLSGGMLFKIGIIFITAAALYEYIKAYKNTKHHTISSIMIIGFILYFSILLTKGITYALPIIFLIVILSMAMPIFNNKYNVISSTVTITGFIYIIGFLSLLILIRDYKHGNELIWLVYIISWCSDTFAYYIGKNFGRKKLCPEVSPKKTVEGSIGGILGSIIGVTVWGLLDTNTGYVWYQLILLGAFGSVIAQIGDLSASLIKRYIGLKDYSKLIPGHGGILDRFDSILFIAPVVYYYIVIFLG